MLRVEVNSARVLVIDPSAHIRRLVITLMAALGIKGCEEARTTLQAEPKVLKNRPDLIVVDLGGDATEALLFVHRLRRSEFGQNQPPVLGMSPSSHHALLELAWEAGVDDVVRKPISAMEILQRTSALLGRKLSVAGNPHWAAE